MNANSKQNSMKKLQATATSIPVYPKRAFLVLFSMYVLYTSDLPTSTQTTLGTFAYDTAIYATHEDPTIASLNLQEHLHSIKSG